MAQNPLRAWFGIFMEIHDHMQTLNHLTEASLKPFSKQKPADLLPTDLMKQNLSQFCFDQFLQHVPDSAFSVDTFLALNDVLAPTLRTITRSVLQGVAIDHDQKYRLMSPDQFGQQLSPAVFDTPEVRTQLFDVLDGLIPTSFFPTEGTAPQDFDAQMTAAGRTVDQAIDKIFS
jgi:hypothetical protein